MTTQFSIRLILLLIAVPAALGIGFFLNALLRRKRIQWLPERRPRFCILPKYAMRLDLTCPEDEWADEVDQRITRLGFRLAEKNDDFHSYKRGSEYGDFSADAVRIAIVVSQPVSNPIIIGLQYASKFGVAFDTGDLWKVADAVRSELTATRRID